MPHSLTLHNAPYQPLQANAHATNGELPVPATLVAPPQEVSVPTKRDFLGYLFYASGMAALLAAASSNHSSAPLSLPSLSDPHTRTLLRLRESSAEWKLRPRGDARELSATLPDRTKITLAHANVEGRDTYRILVYGGMSGRGFSTVIKAPHASDPASMRPASRKEFEFVRNYFDSILPRCDASNLPLPQSATVVPSLGEVR